MAFGREKLSWSQEIWNRIDRAVHDECARIRVARKFLPLYGPVSDSTLTVPSDTINAAAAVLSVDEADTDRLIELQVEFTLTRQQTEREQELMTAVTLATRAANLLCQAEDVVIFQGQVAITGVPAAAPPIAPHPLFAAPNPRVTWRSGPAGLGLIDVPRAQVINVPLLAPPVPGADYGENTFTAVSRAYSQLQGGVAAGGGALRQSHYGPYALVLRTEPFADTHAPLRTTLIMPADRIKPLLADDGRGGRHFYGTGTLPVDPLPVGVMVSIGGNTMDLVVGVDATTAFLQEDQTGLYRFRVFERFALRLKDDSAIVLLEFQRPPAAAAPAAPAPRPGGGGR